MSDTYKLHDFRLYEIDGVAYSLEELREIIRQHHLMYEFVKTERARVGSDAK